MDGVEFDWIQETGFVRVWLVQFDWDGSTTVEFSWDGSRSVEFNWDGSRTVEFDSDGFRTVEFALVNLRLGKLELGRV